MTRFVCRLLLLAFPARFRDQRGRALVQTLLDDSRGPSGRLSMPRFIAGAFDVLHAGLTERVRPAKGASAIAPASTSRGAGWHWDLKGAWRSIRHRPAASLTIVATLALGLGATTAMFTVVDAVLLRPLPYPDDRALVLVGERDAVRRITGVALPALAELAAFPELASLGGYESESRLFKERGEPERLEGTTVSPGFFRTLGVAPILGRTLPADGPLFDPDRKIVLGHDLWRKQFGADAGVVGRLITLEGEPYTILGVMPSDFEFPAGSQFWTTLPVNMRMLADTRVRVLDVVGRLAPGATLEAVDQRLREWSARMATLPDARSDGWISFAITLRDDVLGSVDVALIVVFGGVCLLLGVACANVASLMLAAGRSRLRDYSVQTALGAGRARLVRQIVCEGLMLALAGGAAALLVAAVTRNAIISLSVDQIPRIDTVTVGARGTLFALVAALLATLQITAAPAVLLTRRSSLDLRQHASRTSAGSRSGRRLFGGLVAVEFALALVLVVASGLLFTTYRRLQQVETGLQPSQVLLAHLSIPLTPEWTRGAATSRLHEGLLATLRRGDITDVALTHRRPLEAARGGTEVWASEAPATKVTSLQHSTSEGYFGAIGAQIIAGRDFDRADRADLPPVAIVNDRMASVLWPGADPVGRTLTFPHYRGPVTAAIVGVVRAVRHDGLRGELRPELYLPFRQTPFPPENLVVRTTGDPRAAIQNIRAAIAQLDPSRSVTIDRISTLEENLARGVAQPRFYLVLFGVFACIALALAAFGISGVMTYWLNDRWREMGIRLALGGSRASLVRLMLTRGLTMAGAGLAAGLTLTLAGGRLIESLLFNVAPADPAILCGALAVLAVSAMAACALPARKAALVDPIATLRSE